MQLVGTQLATAVGVVASIVTLVLLIYGWWFINKSWNLSKEQLELVNNTQAKTIDTILKIFDDVVIKCLFPLFTSILGYIFGAASKTDLSKTS